jgi:LacI family transcriptional regulator
MQGLSVLLCDTEEEVEQELNFINLLEEKQVDGILIAAPRQLTGNIVPLLARHRNVVVINRRFDDAPEFSASGYVINDDRAGGRLATEHLLKGGHRVIGFLAGPSTSYGSRRRHQGYRSVLDEAGIPYNQNHVRYCPPTVAGGFEAALALLAEHPEVTALFCFNDMVAIGAIQAGKQLGRSIPEDLAIVGYDGVPVASWVTPSLTTCSVPFEDMGRQATRLLVQRIDSCSEGCENRVLMPALIVRASAP